MRTGLGKLGVRPHIAELAINHVKGGVEAIYDRHRYQREIRAALAWWADDTCQRCARGATARSCRCTGDKEMVRDGATRRSGADPEVRPCMSYHDLLADAGD